MRIHIMISWFAAVALFVAIFSCVSAEEIVISQSDKNIVTLQKAIETAYENNLDIQQSLSDQKIAGAKLDEAKSSRGFKFGLSGNYAQTIGGSSIEIPMLSGQGGYLKGATGSTLFNTQSGATTSAILVNPSLINVSMMDKIQRAASFKAEKPLFMFGLLKNNVRLNRLGVESSGEDMTRVRLEVNLKVKEAFYNFILSQEFLDVAKKTVEQAQTHYEAAKARFEAGATPKFDLIRADVEVASSKENLAKAEKAVELARMALNNAMGLDVNTLTDTVKPAPEQDIADAPRALIETAYKQRPEFKQLALGRLQAKLGAKMSKLLPSGGVVGFQGTYSLLSEGSSFGQQDTWQLAVGAEIPMYDSGVAHNKVRQSEYTVEKLNKKEKQLKEFIALQVNEAYLSMNEARARVETSSAILAQAEEAVRMAETGYKEGVTTNIDVIDAQHGQSGARLNNAQAKFDYEISKARLVNAAGFENPADMEKAVGEGK